MQAEHNNTPTAPSGQQPNSNTPPKRRRYTRRQFLATAAPVLPTVAPLDLIPWEQVKAEYLTEHPEAALLATPPKSLVHYVETHLRIPYRHDVKDPASLAEYVQKIEAHLSEQAEMVEGWADEREVVTEWAGELEPTLEEYLRNEIYAQMDSLAALLVVVEKAGYGEMAEEIIWTENSMEQAAVLNGPRNNPSYCQQIIEDDLWGQEPPVMSDRLQYFASLRTQIGAGLIGALENERNGVV